MLQKNVKNRKRLELEMVLELFIAFLTTVYQKLNNVKKILLLLILPFLIGCDSEEKSAFFFCNYDSSSLSKEWKINHKMIKNEGNKFERFERNQLYGHTFNFTLPDSLSKKSVLVKVCFKFRNHSPNPGKYAFSTSSKESKFNLWEGKSLVSDSGRWAIFQDSIVIPAERGVNTSVKLYPYNAKKTIFDVDSITVRVQQKKFPSFLTDIKKNLHDFPKVKLENPIFHSVALASIINNQIEKSSLIISDSLIIGESNHLTIEINQSNSKNSILWDMNTTFKKTTKVNRLALIYKYKGEITEVYRNNGIASNEIYGNEIWLGKQGFKLSLDSLNWFCYGGHNISSFQIFKEQKLLIVNLDFSEDHPLYHFPKMDNVINKKENVSANIYKANERKSIHNHFRISPSKTINSAPRILPTQHGYQSAFLWTEHADFADFRLHKITYYGDENASGPSEAKAGFVFHNIPVTKSVFYTINDTLKNNNYPKAFNHSQPTSIKKTPGFEAFLDSLHKVGNDICLHTPDFFTSNEKTMEEALEYITKRYGSQTWIDHGYNNGESDNREDFMCDGLNSYAFNLWKKYKIKYFWNGYFEDNLIQTKFKSSKSRTIPFYGFEDQLPFPIFWENNKAPGLFSWRTSTVFYPKSGLAWDYSFSDKILSDFTSHYGIEFSHIYPAHTGHTGFWKFDSDSTFSIQPKFDRALQKMASLRDKGILQLPTVSEFMKHQENLKLVTYRIEKNTVIIYNHGNDIKGLTLVIKKKDLPQTFYSDFPNHRINGEDLIFWFDINKNSQKLLEL